MNHQLCGLIRTDANRESPHRVDIDRVGLGVGAGETRDAEPCPGGEVDAVDREAVVLRTVSCEYMEGTASEKGKGGRVPRNAALLSPASCADSNRDPPTHHADVSYGFPGAETTRARSLARSLTRMVEL
jgi:hypothetical protein